MSLKFKKKIGIYSSSTGNCTFNPMTIEAHSYRWWKFVSKIEGKLVFNDYRYSNTTSKHQWQVRKLLNELGLKIDISIPLPQGIEDQCLESAIEKSEEYLCNRYLAQKLKAQEKYQARKEQLKCQNTIQVSSLNIATSTM
jgi:hypothetical protein